MPRLLDLFCGAGGAAMGYHRAGFEVIGVDINPQPRFPFEFHQADALTYPLDGFDVIHASPPCQAYCSLSTKDGRHPMLIEPTRERLETSVLPYVIENVVGAPISGHVMLCGSMFGLHVRRHRYFELGGGVPFMLQSSCEHAAQGTIRAYYGNSGHMAWKGSRGTELYRGTVAKAPADMGIDWMTWDELREAIPPAYTEWIGRQLLPIIA